MSGALLLDSLIDAPLLDASLAAAHGAQVVAQVGEQGDEDGEVAATMVHVVVPPAASTPLDDAPADVDARDATTPPPQPNLAPHIDPRLLRLTRAPSLGAAGEDGDAMDVDGGADDRDRDGSREPSPAGTGESKKHKAGPNREARALSGVDKIPKDVGTTTLDQGAPFLGTLAIHCS